MQQFEQTCRTQWEQSSPAAQVVRGYLEEVWNERRYHRASESLADEYGTGGAGGPTPGVGNAARFHEAFPDLHIQLDQVVTQADTVATWMTLHGTHLGTFRDHPPSGHAATWHEVGFWQVTSGKISSGHFLADMFGLRKQLGILPPDLT